MAGYTIDEAARISGRTPREVRLLAESGEVPAVHRAGRWILEEAPLDAGMPSATGRAPGGGGAAVATESVSALIARLEQSAVENTQARERVRTLEAALSEARRGLDAANARVAELEAAGFQGSLESRGAREALTPLFRPT